MDAKLKKRRGDAIYRAVRDILDSSRAFAGADTRKHSRVKYREPIEIEFNDGAREIALGKDISLSGIGFVCGRMLSGKVVVTITNAKGQLYRLRVEIMHCTQVGRFYVVGGRFVERLEQADEARASASH